MENHPWNSTENFEQTKPFIYLDTASRSALPIRIAEIGVHALKKKVSPWHGIGSDSDVSEVRSLYAQLINAPSGSSIAIAHSNSIAISIAAKNVADSGRLNSGSSVLLIEKEMASAVYAWQDACLKTGSRLKIVTENANTLSWTDTIIANIDKAVVVIALPHCHWCDGSFIDLERISQYLDDCTFFKTRPYLIIDGTQSIGAMPFDVKRIKPSFVACSVHKWLNAPYGISLIYLDPSFHDIWQPIDHHERARLGSDKCEWDEEGAMDDIRGYPIDFMSGARRIDSG
jgi:selenocysteine lyase/cysteine desulfurase